jgi:hypothetical protein
LDTLNAVRRTEHVLHYGLLCRVELRVLIGKGDGLRTRKNRLDIVLSLTDSADNFMFRLDGFGGRELTARNALRALDDLKFPGSQTSLKIGAHLSMGDLTHATAEPVADQRTFIHNGLALKVLVASKAQRFSNAVKNVDWPFLMLRPFTRTAYNGVRLVPKVCSQLSVCGHHVSR